MKGNTWTGTVALPYARPRIVPSVIVSVKLYRDQLPVIDVTFADDRVVSPPHPRSQYVFGLHHALFPYNTRDSTPAGSSSEPIFPQAREARTANMVSWKYLVRNNSMGASLSVCTLPVAEESDSTVRPRGCVLLRAKCAH